MTLYGNISNESSPRPLQGLAERAQNESEFYNRMQDAFSEDLRVAMPAKVVSYDPVTQTISAQCLIREKVIDRQQGNVSWQDLPLLVDVPLVFPGSGGYILSFPVAPGDEVLLVFQDMPLDAWHDSGNTENWNVRRRHDLSDAIAIPGLSSIPKVAPNQISNGTELRTEAGTAYVRLSSENLVDSSLPSPVLGFPQVQMKAGNAKITVGKTIKIVIVGGVPVPTVLDTVSVDAQRFMINGVDFP
jgi:hypothetical protein